MVRQLGLWAHFIIMQLPAACFPKIWVHPKEPFLFRWVAREATCQKSLLVLHPGARGAGHVPWDTGAVIRRTTSSRNAR